MVSSDLLLLLVLFFSLSLPSRDERSPLLISVPSLYTPDTMSDEEKNSPSSEGKTSST